MSVILECSVKIKLLSMINCSEATTTRMKVETTWLEVQHAYALGKLLSEVSQSVSVES